MNEIPRTRTGGSVAMWAVLLLIVAGCNSKTKVGQSDRKAMQLSEKVENLKQQITRDNYMGTQYIARQQHVDSAYLRKQELMDLATDNELLHLSGDTNAIVSLTAFQGLYNRGNSVVPAIFNGYKNRTDHIQFVRGDLLMEMPMIEYAYVYIMEYELPQEVFPGEDPEAVPKFTLSEEDKRAAVRTIYLLRGRD